MLEKTLEGPLDCKEIQPVHPKGDKSWVFIGRTDVEAETPIFWPPDAKSWLIWKDPDAGKDWGQEEKGMTEDEMVGWHHWLNGHGFGWTPGVGGGQGGLVCCGSWGHKELDKTERLSWTELMCLTFPTVNQRESHNEFNVNTGEKAKCYSHGILSKEFSKACRHLVLVECFYVGGPWVGTKKENVPKP